MLSPTTATTYNATAVAYEGTREVSRQAVLVDEDGFVLRAAGHYSAMSGTRDFDAVWRSARHSFVTDVQIRRDGGAGYREALGRLALPLTYLEAR